MYDAINKEQTIVNGVNVDELNATIEAVTAERGLGKLQFRAANRWVKGARNDTTVNEVYGAGQEHARENSFTMKKDEPFFCSDKRRIPSSSKSLGNGLGSPKTRLPTSSGFSRAAVKAIDAP